MDSKTVVSVITMGGDDVLVYSDGSMEKAVGVVGASSTYIILVPMDIQVQLKADDASNIEFSILPGYVAPAAGGDVGGQAAA